MINNKNTVKPKQRRILKPNYYLKRLLKKLRKRLVRRWQEMPLIRHNAVKDNSNLENRLHTSPKKIQHRTVSTTEEDKISRVKSFKVRSQCSDLNINQDFITLKKTPPLKNFSALIKPMRIFTLSRLICRLPILTKIFYYSEKSIQKSRTRPIVTINTVISAYTPEYKYEYTDFHNKRRSISCFNPDRIIHPYFDFVKKYPLFKKNSFNKSIKPEDSERNLHSFHKSSDNNLSKTCLDNIMQTINNSTAEIFKIKEAAKKFKKDLENSENNQQKTEYLIHQLQDLEKEVIKIESLRIQAMTDIINTDRNSKDSEGKTLAHHLAEYGDYSLLRYLITFRYLDPFIKDNQGFLPKDIANNNRLGITQGHMKATQEFFSLLTPENFKIDPENPPSPLTLDIDTRDYFMPKSHSSKPASSKEGSFPNPHKNDDLIKLIEENKNVVLEIKHLCEKYIFKTPPINFKDVCNSAIRCDQPFYLSLILHSYDTWLPRNNTKDFKETPIIKAIYSEKIYPFAMLLYFKKLSELHLNYQPDNENVFDIANRLEKSFYVFLLAMKRKDLIKSINDEKHKNFSHLKEKINHIIEKSLLKGPYDLIISDFETLEKTLDKLVSINDNGLTNEQKYSQAIKLKSSIEMITNKIEEKLQNLKNSFIQICNLPTQDIENIKTTNPFYSPVNNPYLYPYQGNSQANANQTHQSLINYFYGSYPQFYQNPTNYFYDPHPQSYAFQRNPQANANPSHQNLTNHFHGSHSQPYVFQGNSQASANPIPPNLQTAPNPYPQSYPYQGNSQTNANPIPPNLQTAPNPYPQSYPYQGHPQASANPIPPNLQTAPNLYPQSYPYQGNSQANANPIHQNLQTAYPNPQPYPYQENPQASTNPTHQNLLHTLASHQDPQSSHPVSHSTNRCDFPVTPTILTTELNRGTGNS